MFLCWAVLLTPLALLQIALLSQKLSTTLGAQEAVSGMAASAPAQAGSDGGGAGGGHRRLQSPSAEALLEAYAAGDGAEAEFDDTAQYLLYLCGCPVAGVVEQASVAAAAPKREHHHRAIAIAKLCAECYAKRVSERRAIDLAERRANRSTVRLAEHLAHCVAKRGTERRAEPVGESPGA